MMQRNEIEKCANGVLNRFGIKNAPFSHIKAVCDGEHIKIKKTAFGPNMDGAFSVIDGEKIIFYNSNKVVGRQNFTKAHELGHYFLNHSLENGNAIYCYNHGISEENPKSLLRIETEANYFATFFLMPRPLLLQAYVQIASMYNIDVRRPLYVDRQPCNVKDWTIVSNNLTYKFGVSKESLRYRMESLGILDFRL